MPNLPTLPTTFDVPYQLPTGGTTWNVHQGDNLQTVFDSAALGDVIIIDAGATFTGNFKLPIKSGTDWLYIISSELAYLTEGNRVSPASATHMPCIQATQNNNLPALMPFKSAHHYRFAGIEFKCNTVDPISAMFNIIQMGYGGATYGSSLNTWTAVTSDSDLPTNFTFDRCYIHSENAYPKTCRCGIIMNGHNIACVDSYFKNFADSSDAQAINIWNGGSLYKIVNNYLEATGECFMVGGTDPSVGDVVPSDIEFRGNYLYKDSATWGSHFTIKNLFELKGGIRVLCHGNLMENCYRDDQGQSATAIVLTVRDQSGGQTNAQIKDVTITYNRIHSAGKAYSLTGYDNLHTSQQTQLVLIENNAWDDLSKVYSTAANGGQMSSIVTGPALDITFRHNLVMANGAYGNLTFLTAPVASFVVQNWDCENNIVCHGDFGLLGNGVGTGNPALTAFATGSTVWTKNVMIDRTVDRDYAFWLTHLSSYPAGNAMADGVASVGFTDANTLQYQLLSNSPYFQWGSDGLDPGPDWTVLSPLAEQARTGQTVTPTPPTPTPQEAIFVAVSGVSAVSVNFSTTGKREGVISLLGPLTYPTGGFLVSAANLALSYIDYALVLSTNYISAPRFASIRTPVSSIRIMVFSNGIEIANATDLSHVSFKIWAIGS